MEKRSGSSQQEGIPDPPQYSRDSGNDSSHDDGGTGASSRPNRASDESQRHDARTEYALYLQKACNVALNRVKNNSMIANTNWASPLASAPSAISTMAILLKAADLKAAAGLKVESQEIIEVTMDEAKVWGRLP